MSNNSTTNGTFGVPHHEHPSYKWWVLANVMIGTFMAVLDATIVDVSLAKIMATFGIGVDDVKWVATAYLLVFAVVLPTSGWIADHFGYKRTYTMGLGLFTLGSLLCSLSWNETALVLFRVVQGAGAGFIMPVGMAIVTREFPPEKRGVALGFWAIAAAASVSLGPTLGGYLIDNFSWHIRPRSPPRCIRPCRRPTQHCPGGVAVAAQSRFEQPARRRVGAHQQHAQNACQRRGGLGRSQFGLDRRN